MTEAEGALLVETTLGAFSFVLPEALTLFIRSNYPYSSVFRKRVVRIRARPELENGFPQMFVFTSFPRQILMSLRLT